MVQIANSTLQDVLQPCSPDCFDIKVFYKFAFNFGIKFFF